MNAPHLWRTNVIPTRHVTTLTGLTLAGASKDTKAMVKTVQVIIYMGPLTRAFLKETEEKTFCENRNFFSPINDAFFMKLSFSTAITTGCSPACGANAFCGESSGRPVCTCNPGYQGDGYSCTGWCQWCWNELSSFSSSPSQHQHPICSNTCPNLQILKATKKAPSSALSVKRRQW